MEQKCFFPPNSYSEEYRTQIFEKFVFEKDVVYTGEKADVFYLGCILFLLVVGRRGFLYATKSDKYYSQIIKKNKNAYFKALKIQGNIGFISELSPEFKDLFVKIIAYKESDRPNIKEIINDKWFDELRNDEEKKKIEKELKDMFIEKEKKVIDFIQANPNYSISDPEKTFKGNRSLDDDFEEEIFPQNLIPKKKNIELGMDVYIKIKGNLDYYRFMNSLVDKIKKEFENENYIINNSKAKEKYEFAIIFEADDDDKGEEKDEENLDLNDFEDKKQDCVIQLKLYESSEENNNEYVLKLLRKSGDLGKYYSKAVKIIDLAKKLL